MGHSVVRHGINYGEMEVVELKGIQFAVQAWRVEYLNLTPVEVKEIPQFNAHLYLQVQLANGVNQVECWVFDKADVRKLSAALSAHTGLSVRVYAHARILAVYKDGKLDGEIRTLDSFYTGLTQKVIKETTF